MSALATEDRDAGHFDDADGLRAWIDDHRRDLTLVAATAATIAIAAATLYAEASTEPFHVDEIRQTAPYGGPLREIVGASFAQEQPPLDSMFGALVQAFVGVGDTIQRSSSMLFGLFAMVMLAVLLWRRGFRTAVPPALMTLAISPAFVSFTAYARPYALPLALMLCFAYGADLWLDRGALSGGLFATAAAFALPTTRVFEPPAFLGLAIVTLLIERRRFGRRVWWPIGACAAALLLIEVPVYRQLSAALSDYGDSADRSFGAEWQRLISDSIPRLASDFPWPLLAVVLVAAALAIPTIRGELRTLWWFAPLAGAAIAFAVAFHIQAAPPQSFYARYGYYWLPPFAVIVGLLVRWAFRHRNSDRRAALAIIGVTLLQTVVWTVALVDDFRHDTNTDYRALANAIDAELPPETVVFYDSISSQVGRWRPGFYGSDRYLVSERVVVDPEALLDEPELLASKPGNRPVDQQLVNEPVDENLTSEYLAGEPLNYAIALQGPPLTVEGWTTHPVTTDLTLYTHDAGDDTPTVFAQSLTEFASTARRRNAMLRLAAAAVFESVGDEGSACREYLLTLDENPRRVDAIDDVIAGTSIDALPTRCR